MHLTDASSARPTVSPTTPRLVTATMLCLAVAGCATTTGADGPPPAYVSADASAETALCEQDSPPKTWAVVVGVDFYKDNRIGDLHGAVNDAWSFYHYLASPDGAAVPQDRLRLLLNSEATRGGVEDALGRFLRPACPQDKVIIYFAGHGAPEPGYPDDAFLLVHDTDLDSMVSSAVSMKQLPSFLAWRTGQTGTLLMIIDACHSGHIQFPGERGGVPSAPLSLDPIERVRLVNQTIASTMSAEQGWGVISSSSSNQAAGEGKTTQCAVGNKPYEGGVFTCFLLRALAGAADADKTGTVTVGEAFHYVKQQVYRVRGSAQIPQMSGMLDETMVLSSSATAKVAIPDVPELYRYEEAPKPYRPWLWGTAGLGAAALAGGVAFHVQAANAASDMDQFDPLTGSREEYGRLTADRDDARLYATIGYATAAGLAGATLALFALDLFDEPGGADDVYARPPRFQLGLGLDGSQPFPTVQVKWVH